MDEEARHCAWCGQYIHPDEEPYEVAAYDEEDNEMSYEPICFDCSDSWYL